MEKNAPFSCPVRFVKHQGTLYCWPFSSHIPLSINNHLFPFHLEKNLNFQRCNFLIGILDVCRVPQIYLNAKINFITSLRLLFYSESMRESSPYIRYAMAQHVFMPIQSCLIPNMFSCNTNLFNTQHVFMPIQGCLIPNMFSCQYKTVWCPTCFHAIQCCLIPNMFSCQYKSVWCPTCFHAIQCCLTPNMFSCNTKLFDTQHVFMQYNAV